MASRLEAATKQYGVFLLISGTLYKFFSQSMKEVCRLLDIVTVKGSIKPMELYSIDVSVEGLPPCKDKCKFLPEEISDMHMIKKEYLWQSIE